MQSRRSQRAILVMFLFVVLVFGALAYRGEQQDKRLAELAYNICVVRNGNVERLNHLYLGMIAVERDNPFAQTSPETVQKRIDLYADAVLISADCGKDPR